MIADSKRLLYEFPTWAFFCDDLRQDFLPPRLGVSVAGVLLWVGALGILLFRCRWVGRGGFLFQRASEATDAFAQAFAKAGQLRGTEEYECDSKD